MNVARKWRDAIEPIPNLYGVNNKKKNIIKRNVQISTGDWCRAFAILTQSFSILFPLLLWLFAEIESLWHRSRRRYNLMKNQFLYTENKQDNQLHHFPLDLFLSLLLFEFRKCHCNLFSPADWMCLMTFSNVILFRLIHLCLFQSLVNSAKSSLFSHSFVLFVTTTVAQTVGFIDSFSLQCWCEKCLQPNRKCSKALELSWSPLLERQHRVRFKTAIKENEWSIWHIRQRLIFQTDGNRFSPHWFCHRVLLIGPQWQWCRHRFFVSVSKFGSFTILFYARKKYYLLFLALF